MNGGVAALVARVIKCGGLRQRIDRNLDNSPRGPRVEGLMRSLKFSIYHRRTSEVARVRMPVGMFTQPNSNILNLSCPCSSWHKKCQKISGTCFLNDTATKLGAAMPSSSQIVYDVRGETPPWNFVWAPPQQIDNIRFKIPNPNLRGQSQNSISCCPK